MARRTFQVVDITEILVHWHAGRSISEVAHSLGVDRNTVRKYIAPAVAAGIVPAAAVGLLTLASFVAPDDLTLCGLDSGEGF